MQPTFRFNAIAKYYTAPSAFYQGLFQKKASKPDFPTGSP
jgi:hypothetical protein